MTVTITKSMTEYGLRIGTPDIKSAGPLAFGPDGILFVADNVGATIVALGLGEVEPASDARTRDIDRLDTRLAAYLGCARDDVFIRDMAVRPSSQDVYLSVMRGSGAAAVPVLIRIAANGALSDVPLADVPFSQHAIEGAPAADDARNDTRVVPGNREGEEIEMRNGGRLRLVRDRLRTVTVTDMSDVDGVLLVAGASNEEFSSTLRRIPFPFHGHALANSLEIFHVSHGKYETAAPIRTFVPYGGNTSILASYTCTPVVQFSLRDAAPGAQVKGKSVADLGARSTPIDMVSYKRGGEEYLLVSNVMHPLMKIASSDINRQAALTEKADRVGAARQDMPQNGVGKMANLNGSHVIMMHQDEAGNFSLRSYATETL